MTFMTAVFCSVRLVLDASHGNFIARGFKTYPLLQVVDEKLRTLEIVEPGGAKAKYEAMGAEFGFDLFSNGPASGKLVEASPLQACTPLNPEKARGMSTNAFGWPEGVTRDSLRHGPI